MNAPFIAYINLRNLFDIAPPPLAEFLSSTVHRRNFTAGQRIYPFDQTGPAVLVVERGMVEISLRCGAVRSRVKRVGKGAIFGEMRAVGMAMLQARAVAVIESSMLVLKPEAAQELMEKTAARWVGLVAPMFYDCIRDRDQIKFGTARSRLAALLLEGADTGRGIAGVTQQGLADKLGLTRERLWQALRGLRDDGLVLWNRNRVEIPDIDGLGRAASVWIERA
jgi:CRP-like cAMP-binding protein